MAEENKTGQCYVSEVRFVNNDGKIINVSKSRPIVLFQDPFTDEVFGCKVTSQLKNPKNIRYGYRVQDRKIAGFAKESIIKCSLDNLLLLDENGRSPYFVQPLAEWKPIGQLSPRDKNGLLIRLFEVRQLEQQRDSILKQDIELER